LPVGVNQHLVNKVTLLLSQGSAEEFQRLVDGLFINNRWGDGYEALMAFVIEKRQRSKTTGAKTSSSLLR
jgi:hypothetical protein